MAPPPPAEFPLNVQFDTAGDAPEMYMPPPPPEVPVLLLEKTLPETTECDPMSNIPPPQLDAELPSNVQFVTDGLVFARLAIPPPELVTVLPRNAQFVTTGAAFESL
jgi:hypothetical protein